MKILIFIVAFFFNYTAYSQDKDNSNYDVHYIVDATSSSVFFNKISQEINNVDRVFLSTCFYYVELFKENKIPVDTFDLLSPKNYFLLKFILSKQKKVFGFTKSSYFIPYFKLYTDSIKLNTMNKILDSVKFINKNSTYQNSNNIKRLHSLIEKDDLILVEKFLSYLPDSIIENETLFNLHKSLILDTNYICNSIFRKADTNGSDLIIDYSFYQNIIYGKPKLYLWCSDSFNGNICYHINLSKSDKIKNNKLKRAIRKYFNLKRKDIRKGGNYKMLNGNEVRIYK